MSLVHPCGPPLGLPICLENEEPWGGMSEGTNVPTLHGGCDLAVSVSAPLAGRALGLVLVTLPPVPLWAGPH